jgi:rhamnosyltransferase
VEDGKQHVYIIGSKGIPAKYGGFETFVEKLTEYQVDKNIQYHVACMTENSAKSGISDKHFEHNGAKCFNIDVPNIGPARAIYYDIAALRYAIQIAKNNQNHRPIFYVLACRIGPVINNLKKQISDLNGKLFINPDGHEWMRGKWKYPIRRYWKYSERLMVKHTDELICDSKNIEKYIKKEYGKYSPKTNYISYGTDLTKSTLNSNSPIVQKWFEEKNVKEKDYFLVVGRFVPENNYKTMISQFMKSNTIRDFVIITNVEENRLYKKIKKETRFDKDNRIKFVGTVYDRELLKYIRKNAFAYIHGHEVGGTNPSLLESLISTDLNLLLDVGFNNEVAGEGAIYWKKNNLNQIINFSESITEQVRNQYHEKAKERIKKNYSWELICSCYEKKIKEISE